MYAKDAKLKKLYSPNTDPEHYWEYWENEDGSFTVHWGRLGTKGESEIVRGSLLRSASAKVKKLESKYISKGYKEIDIEDHAVLIIEYKVDGFGNKDDLAKRHALQDLTDEILGWHGLGFCDGGSIGSGTMDVCCFVVNFSLAMDELSDRLGDTEFSDYHRIYEDV